MHMPHSCVKHAPPDGQPTGPGLAAWKNMSTVFFIAFALLCCAVIVGGVAPRNWPSICLAVAAMLVAALHLAGFGPGVK